MPPWAGTARICRLPSAAAPATCGVAMLVPLIVLWSIGRGHDEKTFTPGAAIKAANIKAPA